MENNNYCNKTACSASVWLRRQQVIFTGGGDNNPQLRVVCPLSYVVYFSLSGLLDFCLLCLRNFCWACMVILGKQVYLPICAKTREYAPE